MRIMDDVLYIVGWACAVAASFGVDWRAGLAAVFAACEVTAVLIAMGRIEK